MKAYLFVFALLFSGHLVFAQATDTSPDTAVLHPLLREGNMFLQKNQPKLALSKFQQAWEILNPCAPTEKKLRCLNNLCECYTQLGELDSLKAYAEQGYQLSKTLQSSGIIPTEDFARHKANYYRILQQFPAAIAWQRQNLDYQIQHFSDKISPVADAYNNMGVIYMDSGKFDSAMLMYTEMLRLRRTLPQDNRYTRIQIAKGLQNIGIIHKEAGHLDSAIVKYEEALEICLAEQDKDLEGRILYNTGYAIELLGETERALDYFQKAAAIFLKLYGEQHLLYAIALNKVATMYTDLEDYESALILHNKALAINIAKFGPDHTKVSISKSNISPVLSKLGYPREALKMAREAVEIAERNFQEPHPLKIAAYRILSIAYQTGKINPDSAFYFAVKSVLESQTLYGERSEPTSLGLSEKALALSLGGKQLEALETIQEALIAASRTFDSRDFRKNPEPDDFFQREEALFKFQSKALILSHLYEETKRREYLDMALVSLELGNDVMQTHLQKLGDRSISDYNSDNYWVPLCKDALKITWFYQQEFPSPENQERYFTWMERDKSQKLLLSAKNARAKTFSGIPDSLLQLDAKLAQDLTQLEQQLRNAEEDRDSSAQFKLKNESIFKAKADRNAFIRNLERNYPDYFSLKYQISPVHLAQVHAQLPPKTLLLELSIQQNETDSFLYLIALGPTGETLMQLPLQNGIFSKIERLNALLQNPSLIQTAKRKEFAQISSQLYAQFIQPIENQLVGIQKIIIIGEGITHLIPFEVLMPSAQDKPFSEMDFLIKRFEVSYHYSSTLWANTSTAKTDFVTDLFAFAPVFDQESPKTNIQPFEPATDSTRTFSADGRWSPLPWTEKEVRNIAQIFSKQSKNQTSLLLRAEATETHLKDGLEHGARYIHLASHSFANLKQPKFSGIACSPNPNSATDGTLVVGEIYNLRIPAELVVLSSCESGKGKLLQNEGQLGLNRAFLYAGVPNVLFSLWKVNDQTTSDLMVQFYQGLLKGQSFSSALRSAKLDLIKDPVTAMPNYWSGFLLIGK